MMGHYDTQCAAYRPGPSGLETACQGFSKGLAPWPLAEEPA